MYLLPLYLSIIGVTLFTIRDSTTSARSVFRNRRQTYVRGKTTFWGQPIATAPVIKWDTSQPASSSNIVLDAQIDEESTLANANPADQDHAELVTASTTTTTSTTTKPYVAKSGDFLTLGEASYVAGIKKNKHAEPPTAPPPVKEKKLTLTPRAVSALQRLPDDRLAKLIKSQTKGKIILTPDKIKLFKELDPDVLADLINTGEDLDLILDEDEEEIDPREIVDPVFPVSSPTEWFQRQTVYNGFHPAYPLYSPQLFTGQVVPQSASSTGGTGKPIKVSDAKLKLLQKLKLESIVKMVKREADLDITLEEAEIIKTSTLEELRELIDSGDFGTSVSEPETIIPNQSASGGSPIIGTPSVGTVSSGTVVCSPSSKDAGQVSDSRIRLLQRLKPESIIKMVRKEVHYEITLEEAEWIKQASIPEIRDAMDAGTIGTKIEEDCSPAPQSQQPSFQQQAGSIGGFPSQSTFPNGGFGAPQINPSFSPEQQAEFSRFVGRKRRKRAPKTKEERQRNFLNFYSRLPGSSLPVGTQRGCQPYPGLGRIFFEPGPVNSESRVQITAPQIIHRLREGVLRGNYGDQFPTAALAPYRVIPECATDPNASCPKDLVNTAQIEKMVDEGKPLLLMNCEQQELAQRLIQNGFVFNQNRPFFGSGIG